MEQEPQEVEREGHEHTVEADLPVSNLQNSTDSDKQMEEDEMGLSDESTGKPADGPTDGTAVKLVERHPSNDELTEGHPSDDELTETITVECPTSGQESPLGSAREEDRAVIHTSEDEMACWC